MKRVLYDGIEWTAVQATQPGVCFCNGRKKPFLKGDWILTRQEDALEMKAILTASEFERDCKVLA